MKILIINTGSGGDVLFATPLIRALRVQLEASVCLLTGAEGTMAVSENPYIERTLNAAGGIRRAIASLKGESFTHVFDLDDNLHSRWICMTLRAKVFRLHKPRLDAFLLTRFKIDRFSSSNLADQYLALAKPLGVRQDEMRLDCFIPWKYEVPQEWLPAGFDKSFVVFCLSAPHGTRQLPMQRMIEVCDRINKPVILIGSEKDAAAGMGIEEFFNRNQGSERFEEGLRALNKKTLIYNACGKFNFQQEKSLIRRASHVFTFDSDYVPVASAFGKETFLILGNTVTAFGKYPYQTRFTVLEKQNLPCRPCSIKGYEKCPLGHFKCMNTINMDFYII